MTGTGLLTTRCDPYGIESTVRLMGGQYDEKYMGRYIWYCDRRAVSTFRLICTGGNYGHRLANDTGLIAATHCEGGHEGPKMPLCLRHIREFSSSSYEKPRLLESIAYDAAGHPQFWEPGSVIGGTRATDMCPTCKGANGGRELEERANFLHQQISQVKVLMIQSGILGFGAARLAAMESELAGVSARLDELFASGRVHKCPLKLVEVS
jgi:hypothetical protein